VEVLYYLINKMLDIIKSRCLVKINTPATGGWGWLEKPLWLLTQETKITSAIGCRSINLY
jgi:hypothetical protein